MDYPLGPTNVFMKRITATLMLLLLLSAIVRTPVMARSNPPVPEEWTPENAVAYALANNPDTAIARQRIAIARAAVQEANAAFYPRLDLNASYQQTNNPMYSFGNILNQGVFDDTIDFNDPGVTDNLSMNATLSYRLYNGGRDRAGLDAAEAGSTVSRHEMDLVRSELGFAVVKTLFTIIQAQETIVAGEASLEAIEASLQAAQARHEAGDLLKADLLNLEVHRSEARENLIRARHGLELARRAFLNLLGLDHGKVTIAPDCATDQFSPADLSLDQHPELKKLAAAIQSADARVRQAQGGYYPTADAFAGYQVDHGYEFDGSGNSWLAGIKVNFNLFAGRQTEAQVAAAKARLAEQKEYRRKLSLAIGLEVEQARLALEEAKQRVQVTEKMVEQAEESANLSRERFKEGLLLSSELIDVEKRLTDARVRRTHALTAKRIAVADLRRALGLTQFEIAADAGSADAGS
ncbi:MAG: TolC family protein [Desulfobulbaceae bacterium]|nr:TolC family protein [Desulfobulbaceae bacterium]